MRFRTLIGVTVLVCATLAACATEATTKYTAHFDIIDVSRTTYLVEAVQRVMIGKLTAMGLQKPRVIVLPLGADAASVEFTLPNAEAEEIIEKMTSERFTFELRVQKNPVQDPKNPPPDNWLPTSVTGSSLRWAQAIGTRATGKISIELEFTDDGRKRVTDIFQNNKGKEIGIFVRDLLISKVMADSLGVTDHIVIDGVPTEEIAKVFTDDVNVGLHTTFTKVSP